MSPAFSGSQTPAMSSTFDPGFDSHANTYSTTTLPGVSVAGSDAAAPEKHPHQHSVAGTFAEAGSSHGSDHNKEKIHENGFGDELGLSNTLHEGEIEVPDKYQKLGWMRCTICLIVEAIALGSLSIPSAFATLGMVAGVICCVGIGIVAIYTSYIVGQVFLKFPHAQDYPAAVRLMYGKWGYEITSVMFALFLILVTGSHTLTGTIALVRISQESTCALVWGVVSAIVLFLLALPPTFHEFAVLGFIDFTSIVAAILITIVATGINAGQQVGGTAASGWSAWPQEGVTFYQAFLAVTNIVFAYSFSACQFSFMAEMHTPKDYVKSIWALGLIEIFIYTFVGAIIYVFVGPDVKSPALLSAGHTVSRVAFGVALPVIFISGSINTTVVASYIMKRAFKGTPYQYVKNKKSWVIWVGIIAAVTVVAFVIAEAIPFFNALLGLISSLLISGFTFYFPALFWFNLLKEGSWRAPKNIMLSIANGMVFIIGIATLGLGTYASVQDILDQYQGKASGLRSPFSCDTSSYA